MKKKENNGGNIFEKTPYDNDKNFIEEILDDEEIEN